MLCFRQKTPELLICVSFNFTCYLYNQDLCKIYATSYRRLNSKSQQTSGKHHKVQAYTNTITRWMNTLAFKVNPHKTEAILFNNGEPNHFPKPINEYKVFQRKKLVIRPNLRLPQKKIAFPQ